MKKLVIGVLPMLCIILFTGSMSYAGSAGQDTVIRYYSVSPTAFATGGFNYSTEYIEGWETVAAPINLPDSARVVEFKIWVFDESTTDDCPASLYRTLLNFGSKETMAHVTTSGTVGNQVLVDTTIEHSVIDNATYKYHVDVTTYSEEPFPQAIRFYGMRIKYKISTVIIGINDSESHVSPSHPYSIESYPTPFSKVTTIQYHVQKEGVVVIEIYDEAGRLVRTMVDNTMPKGSHTARWDGTDSQGRKVAAGSYFCVVKTNGESTTKVVYVK